MSIAVAPLGRSHGCPLRHRRRRRLRVPGAFSSSVGEKEEHLGCVAIAHGVSSAAAQLSVLCYPDSERSTCGPDQSLPAGLGALSWLGTCFRLRIDESGKCRPHAAPSSTVARHSPRSIRPSLSADIILSTCCASAAASASFAFRLFRHTGSTDAHVRQKLALDQHVREPSRPANERDWPDQSFVCFGKCSCPQSVDAITHQHV